MTSYHVTSNHRTAHRHRRHTAETKTATAKIPPPSLLCAKTRFGQCTGPARILILYNKISLAFKVFPLKHPPPACRGTTDVKTFAVFEVASVSAFLWFLRWFLFGVVLNLVLCIRAYVELTKVWDVATLTRLSWSDNMFLAHVIKSLRMYISSQMSWCVLTCVLKNCGAPRPHHPAPQSPNHRMLCVSLQSLTYQVSHHRFILQLSFTVGLEICLALAWDVRPGVPNRKRCD